MAGNFGSEAGPYDGNMSHWHANEDISFLNGTAINNQLEISTHKSGKTVSTKPPKSDTTEIISHLAVL